MVTANYINIPEWSGQEQFDRGYEACYENFVKIVKKLGKKHHKEFLMEVKKKDNKFYSSYTVSTHPHRCNCEFCELKD